MASLLAHHGPLVGLQSSFPGKAPPIFWTPEWLLPTVAGKGGPSGSSVEENPATLWTWERPLPTVHPGVLNELALLGETLATLPATERLSPLCKHTCCSKLALYQNVLPHSGQPGEWSGCTSGNSSSPTHHTGTTSSYSGTLGSTCLSDFPLGLFLCFGYLQDWFLEWLLWCCTKSFFNWKTFLRQSRNKILAPAQFPGDLGNPEAYALGLSVLITCCDDEIFI